MTNKFNAVEEVCDGYKFASGAEKLRYIILRSREQSGEIFGLVVHPKFILQPGFTYMGKRIRAITFTADFRYVECGDPEKIVIEDVKGGKATITEAFNLRWKIAKRLNPSLHFRIVKM